MGEAERRKKLLLVDDEANLFLSYIGRALGSASWDVNSLESLEQASNYLGSFSESLDAVVLDAMFPLATSEIPVFRELTGEEPSAESAFTLGLALVDLIHTKLPEVFIAIVTSVPYTTNVWTELQQRVEYYQQQGISIELYAKANRGDLLEDLRNL